MHFWSGCNKQIEKSLAENSEQIIRWNKGILAPGARAGEFVAGAARCRVGLCTTVRQPRGNAGGRRCRVGLGTTGRQGGSGIAGVSVRPARGSLWPGGRAVCSFRIVICTQTIVGLLAF